MSVKKIDLGFVKIERHEYSEKHKPKFIKMEKSQKHYTPTLESNIDISVVPKSMEHLTKKETAVKHKMKKPKRFAGLLNEIKLMFANIIVFEAFLTALILFLVSYLLIIVFNGTFWHSFIAPVIYIGIQLFKKLRENEYKEVEGKFPSLNEKIRTAADNIYSENPVVDELRHEVSSGLKTVDYASFFNERRNTYKAYLIILLCVGLIFLAKYDVNLDLDLKEKIAGIVRGEDGEASGVLGDLMSAVTGGQDVEIYGDESLVELGDEEIAISMDMVGYEINMDDVSDPEYKEFEQSLFPPDAGLESADVYGKDILREHKELVKNYFKNMAEG